MTEVHKAWYGGHESRANSGSLNPYMDMEIEDLNGRGIEQRNKRVVDKRKNLQICAASVGKVDALQYLRLPTQPPMVLGLTEEEDVLYEVGVDLAPSRETVPEGTSVELLWQLPEMALGFVEPERGDACASGESCTCAGTRRACTTNRDVWPDVSDPPDYLGHQLGRARRRHVGQR